MECLHPCWASSEPNKQKCCDCKIGAEEFAEGPSPVKYNTCSFFLHSTCKVTIYVIFSVHATTSSLQPMPIINLDDAATKWHLSATTNIIFSLPIISF